MVDFTAQCVEIVINIFGLIYGMLGISPLCIGLALRELISPVIPRLNEIAASVRSMLEGLGGLVGG